MRDLANARIAFCESENRRLQKFVEEAEELVASDDQDGVARLPTAATAEIRPLRRIFSPDAAPRSPRERSTTSLWRGASEFPADPREAT
jgi:hypothetical protein